MAKTANCLPNVPVHLILLNGRTLLFSWCTASINDDYVSQPSLKLDMAMTQNCSQWNETRRAGGTFQETWGNSGCGVCTLCSFPCFFFSPGVPIGALVDIPGQWWRAPPQGWWRNEQKIPGQRLATLWSWLSSMALPTSGFPLCKREAKVHLVKPLLFWVFWHV